MPPIQTEMERREAQFHARHAAEAARALHEVGEAGLKLRKADAARCYDYAAEVLGERKYAPWLQVYSAVSGAFKEGWIPDNFYGARVVPVIQGPPGRISAFKSLSGLTFGSPAFPDVGSQINGALFDRDYRLLSFAEARALFFAAAADIVFKSDASGRGQGIRFLDRNSFEERTVARLGNGVFQRRIQQHVLFDAFSASSLATIRLTTVVEASGAISLRAAYLRLGTGSDTHVQSRSHARIAIDVASGAFDERGFLANWRPCSAHSTSGEPFAGKIIPAFAQCVQTVVSLHERVRFVRAIGWDLAVDRDDKVHVLEWNGLHNDIKFSEATSGPCFTGLGWEKYAG